MLCYVLNFSQVYVVTMNVQQQLSLYKYYKRFKVIMSSNRLPFCLRTVGESLQQQDHIEMTIDCDHLHELLT